MKHEERYSVSMKLKTPRSDLLTFGFISRDYRKDHSAILDLIALQKSEDDDFAHLNDVIAMIDETPIDTNGTHPAND